MPVNEAAVFGSALVHFYRLTGEQKYLGRAQAMMDRWLAHVEYSDDGSPICPYMTSAWNEGWQSGVSLNTRSAPANDRSETFHKAAFTILFAQHLYEQTKDPRLAKFTDGLRVFLRRAARIDGNQMSFFPRNLDRRRRIGGRDACRALSEDPSVSVCLLEAGGDGRDLLIRAPAGLAAMVPGRPVAINNWAYETVPQPGLGGRQGYQPRGRALGGSSVLNTMLYVRGHPSDYDGWAEMGCDGWSFNEVLPYFRRSERNQRGASSLHGGGGPLQVGEQQDPRRISQAFIDAAAECQVPRNGDFNGAEQEGAGYFQVTQFWDGARKGERCSAAAAYLHPAMKRPNLTVMTRARATGIVFDGKRASGVRFRQGRRDHVVSARREVILSGGAHARKLHFGYGFSCHVCVLRPFSRGEVGLLDADPLGPPRIDPRFLSDERDATLLLKGVRRLREILAAPALAKYRTRELHPGEGEDDASLMKQIRERRHGLSPGRNLPDGSG